MRTLVWFRGKDLRVSDHEPLRDAARTGEVVCLFVLDPYFFAPVRARELPHRIQFLLESLTALAANLERLGSKLILVQGKSVEVVPQLARAWRVDRVVAHRWTEPFARVRDARVAEALHVPFELWEGETIAPQGSILTAAARPFSVFTPFARAHRAATSVAEPHRAPRTLPAVPADIKIPDTRLPTLQELGIAHNKDVLPGGERAARERLTRFCEGPGQHYTDGRNQLDRAGTSRLSVDLKFGTLSVRTVWAAARRALETAHPAAWLSFSNELLWREFTYDLLFHRPALLERPGRVEWQSFPWENNDVQWQAWCDGQTGYPVIDAAARQLLGEGFVHNRARMITASFLVKDLLIDYRRGEAHYMKYLTDGDWAANNAGWQWSAGCGCDAQPFFRVFNPVDQAKRFDASGAYVRRWVPEIAALPDAYLHAPWMAPETALRASGVELGTTYPRPIVDHKEARARFLAIARDLRR
ncbi:MAG: deoxyribodipyrimidine photo-lyase [Polyangiales bacterium]